MNKNIKLSEFLDVSRSVSENYFKAWGKWSLDKQWKKIKEEEKEFEFPENSLNELEEFWDNFFAKLTLLHLKGVDNYAIFESAISTWNKIYNRSLEALKEKEMKKCQY